MTKAAEIPPAREKDTPSPYAVACGMLAQDGKYLLPLYLLLIAPQLAAVFITAEDVQNILIFLLIGRIVDLIFLFVVGTIWLRRLSIKALAFSLKPLVPIISVGLGMWMLFAIPLAAQFTVLPSSIKLMLLILLAPAVLINFRLFFFFVPLLLGQSPSREAFKFAQTYTEPDQYLALKIVLAPAALSLLIPNIISIFSPDERSMLVSTLVELSAGIFWLLTTYSALAFAFLRLPEATWHAHGLDPYRNARLITLSMHGPQWFAKFLSPKKAVTLFVLSGLIWSANFLRLNDMPPAPTLRVESIEAHGSSLMLKLAASDEQYEFRGFHPILFALAGPQRGLISKSLEHASVSDLNTDARFGLPPSKSATLTLEFLTERPAEDLVKLEDLYLWYRHAKLFKIDMTKAKITEEATAPPEPAGASR